MNLSINSITATFQLKNKYYPAEEVAVNHYFLSLVARFWFRAAFAPSFVEYCDMSTDTMNDSSNRIARINNHSTMSQYYRFTSENTREGISHIYTISEDTHLLVIRSRLYSYTVRLRKPRSGHPLLHVAITWAMGIIYSTPEDISKSHLSNRINKISIYYENSARYLNW